MISSIQSLVDKYLHLYPAETEDLKLLLDQLEQSEDITSRKNFVGHVTASGFIINENSRQVLLLKHKSLGKLLQPGGHIETHDESFTDAALREIEEETGLKRSELRLRSAMPGDPEVPFDIDSHYIPNNEKKQEPAHYHHDFRYVYTTTSSNVIIDATESTSYKWIDWEDFSEAPNFTNIADKINSTLEPNASGFFRSLTKNDSKKLSVIAVAHIIPSSEDYIRCLREDFNLIGIIPKPKSINQASEKRLLEEGTVLLNQFSRASINNNLDELISFLQPFDNICIVDIGGYFSNCMAQLKQALGSKLLGVVEDTENGLQKYENNLTGEYAVMSVARSPLKNYEDQLVGHSIAHATETVLRKVNLLITYKSCGIIGYGKIGRGIAEYLQQRGVKPFVSEIKAIRSVQASCDGAILSSTEDLIKNSDVIFCATGSRALDLVKLRGVKKGAFIASATSSDDEFNLDSVDDEYKRQIIDETITLYTKRGHSFHLLNEGNAINFLFSAAVDKYIYLVQGELIFSLGQLAKKVGGGNTHDTILTNIAEDHESIARSWLDYLVRNDQPN